MTIINVEEGALDLWSDLIEVGPTEDGETRIGECFRVCYSTPDGRRFLHERGFSNLTKGYSEDDGYPCVQYVPEAKEQALELLERVQKKGVINLLHWDEGFPHYGSAAHCEEEIILWERGLENT